MQNALMCVFTLLWNYDMQYLKDAEILVTLI